MPQAYLTETSSLTTHTDQFGKTSVLQDSKLEAEADKLAETKAAAKVAALQDEHLKVVEPLQSRISGLEGSIEQLVIVNGATAAITAAKGSLPLLLPFVQSHTRIRWEENKPVAELLGPVNKTRIRCYATGSDTEW